MSDDSVNELDERQHCGGLSWRFTGPIDWCPVCGALRINGEWTRPTQAGAALIESVRTYLDQLTINRNVKAELADRVKARRSMIQTENQLATIISWTKPTKAKGKR
jgi:NMD protein affecting ribosome stability and mRNA decay